MTATLFGLGEELKRLESLVSESEDGEIDAALSAYLDDVNVAVEKKVETYCRMIGEISARWEARMQEAKRIESLAKADDELGGKMERRLKEFMLKTGRTQIETTTCVVRVKGAGGVQKLEYIGDVPAEYTKTETVTYSGPDQEKIRQALKEKKELPFVKLAERGKVLVIK